MTAREKNAERMRRWRAIHPEKAKAHSRSYYERNAEQQRERKRLYYQQRRKLLDRTEEGRLAGRLKKARRRVGGSVTAAEWAAIIAAHDGCCRYCGRADLPLEMDHVVAITNGGKHEAANIVPACKPCNASKGNRW